MAGSFLKISDAASIALHAMMTLAQKDELLSVKDMATRLDVSANHLSKVLQRLTKSGFIESTKGSNGGFRLCTRPDQVTFLEIYESIDGKLKTSDCLLSRDKCKKGDCMFGDLISSINCQVRDKFKNTKLSDFIK